MISKRPRRRTPGPALATRAGGMHLPSTIYTQWYWKVDLQQPVPLLRLRADAHGPIRNPRLRRCHLHVVADWVPRLPAAFEDTV